MKSVTSINFLLQKGRVCPEMSLLLLTFLKEKLLIKKFQKLLPSFTVRFDSESRCEQNTERKCGKTEKIPARASLI